MYSLLMHCSLNSVDPALCLGSQDMCFLIREPSFNIPTLTLSRKLKLQCLLCFAYQEPRLFKFPALQPPVPIWLWKIENSSPSLRAGEVLVQHSGSASRTCAPRIWLNVLGIHGFGKKTLLGLLGSITQGWGCSWGCGVGVAQQPHPHSVPHSGLSLREKTLFSCSESTNPIFYHELGWWPHSHQAAGPEQWILPRYFQHPQAQISNFLSPDGFSHCLWGLIVILAEVLLPQPGWALLCWELQPVPAEQSHKLLTSPSYSNLLTTAL